MEISLGIVCGCIPPTRPLFAHMFSWAGIGPSKVQSNGGSSSAKNVVHSLRFKRSTDDDVESNTEIALTDIRQDIEVTFDVSDASDAARNIGEDREGDSMQAREAQYSW